MYEISFPKLGDRYFKAGPWPSVDLISDLVDQDHVFCLLYKELYFRHLYARGAPGLRARCESWDNYCELFGVILHGNVNMVLPVSTFFWFFLCFSSCLVCCCCCGCVSLLLLSCACV